MVGALAAVFAAVFAVVLAAGGSVSSAGANRDDRVSTTFPDIGVAVGLNSRVGNDSITRRVVSLRMASTIRLHGELCDDARMAMGCSVHVIWTADDAVDSRRTTKLIAVRAITPRLGGRVEG